MSTSPGEIDKVFVELNTNLRKFKQEFAMEFQRRLENRTPVQKGFLLSNTQDYAYYVEFGTPVMAPRAMVRTTLLEKDAIAAVAKQRAGIK